MSSLTYKDTGLTAQEINNEMKTDNQFLLSLKRSALVENKAQNSASKIVKLESGHIVTEQDYGGQAQLIDTLFSYIELRTCTNSALAILPAIATAVHVATGRIGSTTWSTTDTSILDVHAPIGENVDTHERWVSAMLRLVARHTCNTAAVAVKEVLTESLRAAMLMTPMTYLDAIEGGRIAQLTNTDSITKQPIQILAEMAIMRLGKAMEVAASCPTARFLLYNQMKVQGIVLDKPMDMTPKVLPSLTKEFSTNDDGKMLDGREGDMTTTTNIMRSINNGMNGTVSKIVSVSNMNGTVQARCVKEDGTEVDRYMRKAPRQSGKPVHWQEVIPRQQPLVPDRVVRNFVDKCVQEYEQQNDSEIAGASDVELAAARNRSIDCIDSFQTTANKTSEENSTTITCNTALNSLRKTAKCQRQMVQDAIMVMQTKQQLLRDITAANSRESDMSKGGAYYLTGAERAVWSDASRYVLSKAEWRAWAKAKKGHATRVGRIAEGIDMELAHLMKRSVSMRTSVGIDTSSDDDTTDEDMPDLIPITPTVVIRKKMPMMATVLESPAMTIVSTTSVTPTTDSGCGQCLMDSGYSLDTPTTTMTDVMESPAASLASIASTLSFQAIDINDGYILDLDCNVGKELEKQACADALLLCQFTKEGSETENGEADMHTDNRPTEIVRRSHRIANRTDTPHPKRSRSPTSTNTRYVRQKTLPQNVSAHLRVADAILQDPTGEMRIRIKFPIVTKDDTMEMKQEWLLVHNTTSWKEVVNLVQHYIPFHQCKVAVNGHSPLRLNDPVGKHHLYKDDCIHVMQKHRGGSTNEDMDDVVEAVEPLFGDDWYEENDEANLPPQQDISSETSSANPTTIPALFGGAQQTGEVEGGNADHPTINSNNTGGVTSGEGQVEDSSDPPSSELTDSDLSDEDLAMKELLMRGDDGDEREEPGPARTPEEQAGDAVLVAQLKMMGIMNEDGSSNEDFLQFVEARNQNRQAEESSSERSHGRTDNYRTSKQVWGEGERVQMTAPRQAIENTSLYQSIAAGVDIIANRLANPTTTISPEIPTHGPGTARPVFGPTHEPRLGFPQQDGNQASTEENSQPMFSQIGESRSHENMDVTAQSHHEERGYDTSDQEHDGMSSRLLRNQSIRQQVDTRVRRRRQSDIDYNEINNQRDNASPTTPARSGQGVNKGGLRGGQSQVTFSHGKVAEPSFHGYSTVKAPRPPPPPSELTAKLRASIKLPAFSGRSEDWKRWARALQGYLSVNELDGILIEGYLTSQSFSYIDNKFVYYVIDQAVVESTKATALFRTAPMNDGHSAYMALYNGYTFTGTASAPILMAKLTNVRLRSGELLSAFILRLREIFEDLEALPGQMAFEYNNSQKIHYLLTAIRHERDLQPAYHAIQMATTRGEITFEEACDDLRVRCEAIRADEELTPGNARRAYISTESKRINADQDRTVSFAPTTPSRFGKGKGRFSNNTGNRGGATEKCSLCLADGCNAKDRLPFCRLHFAEMVCGRVTARKLREGMGIATYDKDTNRAIFPSTVPEERQRGQRVQ